MFAPATSATRWGYYMALRDSLPEFRELRTFAMEAIPLILSEEDGTIGKTELHRRVEEGFSSARGGWPKELDEIGGLQRRATNAIAWASAALTSKRVIHPCIGTDFVRLLSPNAARGPERGRPLPSANGAVEAAVRVVARNAMSRALRGNLPFDLTFVEDLVLAVRRAGYRCAISGRAFDLDYRTPGAGGTHYAPSPDRIDPRRGYVRGNVRWILWCLNRGKGEMPADDFLELCRLVWARARKTLSPRRRPA